MSAIHCNKNFYSTVTSIKWPLPASCRPKGDFVLFYISIKQLARFEVGPFWPDEGKE